MTTTIEGSDEKQRGFNLAIAAATRTVGTTDLADVGRRIYLERYAREETWAERRIESLNFDREDF